jgi:hypothetical protein
MVSVLILDTPQHMAVQLANKACLLFDRDVLQCLLR